MICNLTTAAQAQAPPIPIVSSRCLNRIQVDLVDFRTTPDGDYKWAIQIKCHFSRFITLDALKDKTAASVAEVLAQWIRRNGKPRRL